VATYRCESRLVRAQVFTVATYRCESDDNNEGAKEDKGVLN